MEINFCTQCGGKVSLLTQLNDSIPRHVCNSCGFVHYLNPKITAGCLIYQNKKVLLCKRGIEPRKNLWTTPGGFMENNETSKQAAKREVCEETSAKVSIEKLYMVANLPKANFIYLLYLARLKESIFSTTNESIEIKLFDEKNVPWDNIAFHTTKLSLQYFFNDAEKNQFKFREIDF